VNGSIYFASDKGNWSIGASVRNLFYLRRAQFGGYSPTNAGQYPYYYLAYNEPRTFNITLSKNF